MNGWLLHRFNSLRRGLLEAGKFDAFCTRLRATASPDGSLSLYEVIDSTTPEQWQAAAEAVEKARGEQIDLAAVGGAR